MIFSVVCFMSLESENFLSNHRFLCGKDAKPQCRQKLSSFCQTSFVLHTKLFEKPPEEKLQLIIKFQKVQIKLKNEQKNLKIESLNFLTRQKCRPKSSRRSFNKQALIFS